MDVLPLQQGAGLDRYEKLAVDLVGACHASDARVREWAIEYERTIVANLDTPSPFVESSIERAIGYIAEHMRGLRAANCTSASTLEEAQELIARAHGFDGWRSLAQHVEAISRPHSEVHAFERAADAIVSGDPATLEALLEANRALARARSTRSHRATILHYVAANGVEDFRQRTPSNAVAIARALLDAGAAVDELAETYGGGTAQTPMNLLVSSAHPAAAGVQAALAELLLDRGAAIDGVTGDGSPLMTALAFGYHDAAETLARRGARVDNIVTAAALGRPELVNAFLNHDGSLALGVPLSRVQWPPLPADPKVHVALGLVWACKFGRTDVVKAMLAKHVDPASADVDDMTGLHWAAANGHMAVMDLLLTHGAPLEVKNRWGGTVLDSTVFFAVNGPVAGVNYPAIIERLLAAGADLDAVRAPTGDVAIDDVLRHYRARRQR